MHASTLLVYGATGYTGRLLVEAARASGIEPIVAARDEAALERLASGWRLPARTVRLDEPVALRSALTDVDVVIHAAGPFSHTWSPMVDACLATRTHYLDVTGEMSVIEAIAARDGDARRAGVMLMPAVGFDVVPSDALAAHVARRMPDASHLSIAVSGLVSASRGSMKTLVEQAGAPACTRRGGRLAASRSGVASRRFDFGDGPRDSVAVSWGDVASAWYTTGIPNIDVCFEATAIHRAMVLSNRLYGWAFVTPWARAWMQWVSDRLPPGPTAEERECNETTIVAIAENDRGQRAEARLHGPEAYRFTSIAATAIARRVLAGDWARGFHTPGRAYGPDFVLGLPDVTRVDVD
ncbi:MAG: saccharopine dehydrogenase NADP-binding domain-containing protein [bacterium]